MLPFVFFHTEGCLYLDLYRICWQVCSLPISHCIIISASSHMQVKLSSIIRAQGDLWSAVGQRKTPPTDSAYTLFGCMIYELCPRVAGFIFLLLTAPSALGARAPQRWRKRETRFFDPWIHQTSPDVQPFFPLMQSVSLMSVHQHSGCCCCKVTTMVLMM